MKPLLHDGFLSVSRRARVRAARFILSSPGMRLLITGALLIALMLVGAACAGDDEEDEQAAPAPTATSAPPTRPSTALVPTATPVPSSATPSRLPPAVPTFRPVASPSKAERGSLPAITTMADVLFTDLATGRPAFEVDVNAQYGDQPVPLIEPLEEGRDLPDSLRQNLRWLADQGYTALETFAVEGFGTLYLRSPTLEPLRHEGFDYNSQYDGDLMTTSSRWTRRRPGSGTMSWRASWRWSFERPTPSV